MDKQKWKDIFQPYTVYGGEMLVTKLGDPPGMAAIYPKGIGPAMVTPDVMKMNVNPDVMGSTLLMHYMNSEYARNFAFGVAYGVTRLRMNLTIFRQMPVPVAPLAEQKELEKTIQSYFDRIKSSTNAMHYAASEFPRIDAAILSQAFRGELV
ncbi:MAG: hypothetical protein JXX14_23410 [Deltaproteobacteria bacterium]|nr:hypothetical protein [Deltaproteobacteria bacterium]